VGSAAVSSAAEGPTAGPRGVRGALRNLTLKGGSLALERVCRLSVAVAAARLLGQATFGAFVYASTVTTLLALGTDLGLSVWTTRALARGRGGGERVIRVGLVLRAAASVPYLVALLVVAALGAHGERDAHAGIAIGLLGVAALVNAFVDHFGAILRGYERFTDEAVLNALRALSTLLAGLLGLVIGRSLVGFCAGLATAGLAAGLYGAAALRRIYPRVVRGEGWLDRRLARMALGQSLPIWFAGLVSLLYFKNDTLFVRALAGDAELGAYGAAFKFFEGAMIVPAVILAVAFPRLARSLGDRPVQVRIEWRLGLVLVGLGTCAGAACFIAAPSLVRIVFGRSFGRAVPSLRVLALGLPLLYLNFGLTHFLVARDMGRATLVLALVMLMVNVACNLALIPRYLGPGAAWATVLTEVALSVGCFASLRETRARLQTLPKAPGEPKTTRTAA
jgi:O-antigen/teichoic acid export membrane protein